MKVILIVPVASKGDLRVALVLNRHGGGGGPDAIDPVVLPDKGDLLVVRREGSVEGSSLPLAKPRHLDSTGVHVDTRSELVAGIQGLADREHSLLVLRVILDGSHHVIDGGRHGSFELLGEEAILALDINLSAADVEVGASSNESDLVSTVSLYENGQLVVLPRSCHSNGSLSDVEICAAS